MKRSPPSQLPASANTESNLYVLYVLPTSEGAWGGSGAFILGSSHSHSLSLLGYSLLI